MTTRRVIDAKDKDGEKVYVKGHAKATYMSDGRTVEDAIKQIGTGGGGGGITAETDPIFSASPAATITEDDKAAWSGKQDAISDLATIREGAVKGATAIQSHQDISGKQDKLVSGTNIKTINGTSILGSGDIVIEGGGGSSSGGSDNYPVVVSDATYIIMNPNTYYLIESEAEEVQLEFSEETEGIVNEYIVQFTVAEFVIGAVGDGITVSMPDTIVWANNNIPTFAFGKTYVISVVNNLACYAEF
jgi:hypothetical protein